METTKKIKTIKRQYKIVHVTMPMNRAEVKEMTSFTFYANRYTGVPFAVQSDMADYLINLFNYSDYAVPVTLDYVIKGINKRHSFTVYCRRENGDILEKYTDLRGTV